jgi:AcrR family transcriptional regulator
MEYKKVKQRSGDTKSRILAISEELFADKGFDDTGIDEIAKKVGIAKSVIYYHFKNKDEILHTMYQNFITELLDLKVQKAYEYFKDREKALSTSINDSFGFLDKRKKILKIILMESIKKTEDVPLFTAWDANLRVAEKLYEEITSKKMKNMPEQSLEMFFMGFLPIIGFIVFMDKWCEHYTMDKKEAERKFMDIILKYLESFARRVEY